MPVYRISLHIFDPKFGTEELKSSDGQEFHISPISDSTAIFILPPAKYVFGDDLPNYERWVIAFLNVNKKILIDPGANDIHLEYAVFKLQNEQCNFSIFDEEQLKVISSLNIGIPISVYGMTQKEMLILLEDSSYDQKTRIKISKSLI